MPTVATMVVRIGANVEDLTKGMDKATKEVAKASKQIAALGKTMTLYITAPAAIAAYEFSKMAAEAENLGDRLERVFGDKTQAMKDFIADMRHTVPESTMKLSKFAIEVQNLGLNLGMTRQQAFDMSEGLLQMAADAAAFAHVPMEEAMQAFERGLAGKTRGLIQFQMVISQSDVKQRGFKMGLMANGKELNALGRALASYSLMHEQSSRLSGEAARIAGEESVRFQMLKANFVDMAVSIGTRILPAVMLLVDGLNSMMNGLDKISPKIVTFGLILIGIAASVGPILMIVSAVGRLVVLIRGLVAAAAAASTVLGFLAALTAPEIIVGLALIAAGITGIILLIKKLKGEAKNEKPGASRTNPLGTAGTAAGITSYDPENQGTAFDLLEKKSKAIAAEFQYAQARGQALTRFYAQAAQAQQRLTEYAKHGADEVKRKAIEAMRALQGIFDEKTFTKMGLGKQTGQLFGLPAADVLQRLAEKGDQLSGAFENAVKQGGDLSAIFAETYREASMLEDIIDAQPDKLGEVAVAAGKAYEKLRYIMRAGEILGFSGSTNRAAGGGHAFNATAQAAAQYGQDTNSYNENLRVREELLKLPPVFNKVREAAIQVAERHRQVVLQLQLTIITFRSFRYQIQALMDVLTGGMDSFLQMISAASIGQHVVDNLLGRLSGAIDNMVNRAINWVGGLFGIGRRHKTGHGTPFDALIQGMQYASTRLQSSTQLRALEAQVRLQLAGNLSLEQRITAEARLTQIQQALGEAITGVIGVMNAPSGFKIALARFNATNVGQMPASRVPAAGPSNFYGNIYIQAGSRSVKELMDEVAKIQRQKNRRGGASSLNLAVAGA